MRLAYLMNSYPMTSTTFIRREIEALEANGLQIERLAVRAWPHPLVDEDDVVEQQRTHYLFSGNLRGLILAFGLEILQNGVGVLRSLGSLLELSRAAGWQIIRPAAYLLQAAYLKRYAALHGIEHLHVHFATNATAVAMLSMQMGGPTYSFTAHGPDELVTPERLCMGLKIEQATFVVAISNYCHAQLLRLRGTAKPTKIHLARCGLALEDFADAPAPVPDNQTFVCVGRFCKQKAQAVIPPAVAALQSEFPGLKVVLIGDGECRREVEEAVQYHNVAHQIELRGWAPNTEVRQAIRDARALLLPSRAEGVPIVIMEALSLGRPVISTTVGGIPELLDDSCGWLIPPDDPESLVEAMRSALLCTPGELSEKGLVGRARVAIQNDRKMLAAHMRRLFDLVAENRTCEQKQARAQASAHRRDQQRYDPDPQNEA